MTNLPQFIESVKEKMLADFLKKLNEYVFVKSIDSITDEVQNLNPVIEDMEATIRISGEWDREDLKTILTEAYQLGQKERDAESLINPNVVC